MNEKLLVVDDNKVIREVLCRLVSRQGYEVATASSGEEALAALEQESFHLVLLDLVMDGMDGLAVLREIRQKYALLELPVLIVSATTDGPHMVEALDLGANDYLTKPYDHEVLLAKIRRHLAVAQPAATAPTFHIGSKVAHYELLEVLGEGSFGRVYRARDTRLLRPVALKVMLTNKVKDEVMKRFVTEAQAVARASHPNVVTVYEISERPVAYLAMELVEGHPLDRAKLPLSGVKAAEICAQILDALHVVHQQGVIHRDLKPANVMIASDGHVKVTDFGVAKILEHQLDLTTSGQVLGTPAFMSPEQIDENFGGVDPRTDLFSVGGVLYNLLTGKDPFPAQHPVQQFFAIVTKDPIPPKQLQPSIPDALEAICLKALSKAKADRYQTAREFAAALRSFQAAE